MTKHFMASLALASLIAASGAAQAQVADFSIESGRLSTPVLGYQLGYVNGQATLGFSAELIRSLYTSNGLVSPAGAGVLVEEFEPDKMLNHVPLSRVSGSLDISSYSIALKSAEFKGGFSVLTSALLPMGKKNGATTGGSLVLSDFKVDFLTRSIYADLSGGNGVGPRDDQLIWHFDKLEGSTESHLRDGCPRSELGIGTTCFGRFDLPDWKLSGLTITQEAFDLTSQSLGLTSNLGVPLFATVEDYGTLSFSSTIPEPSAAMLMLLGLAGLAWAAGQRRV